MIMPNHSLKRMYASTVLMVPPLYFAFNSETSITNHFQTQHDVDTQLAIRCFDEVVACLQRVDVNVILMHPDNSGVVSPDAVFPNNWFSMHINNGSRHCVIYPLLAENRRDEVRLPYLRSLLDDKFPIDHVLDLRGEHEAYLEGTGSCVFDHCNKQLFACYSARTDHALAKQLADYFNYDLIAFHACDNQDQPIYHTNLMMSIGFPVALCCFDVIRDDERQSVYEALSINGREVMSVSYDQMQAMLCNTLFLNNAHGDVLFVLSKVAYRALTDSQRKILEKTAQLISVDVDIFENIGGGGIRCMLAEIY